MSPHPRLALAALAALALAGTAPTALHAQLYYGGDAAAGPWASWINNPDNPTNQIVFDNFVIGAGQTWTVSGVFGTFVETNVSPALTTLSWEIRTGMVAGSSVGSVVTGGSGAFVVDGAHRVVATPLFDLGPGEYWLGMWADLTGVAAIPDPIIDPFFGPDRTEGAGAVNAPSDGAAIWLVGADAANVGGQANAIAEDFSYGVTGTVVSTVPEPGTWALLGTGLLALGALGRARRRRG